jgi:hypothetical protein
MIMRAMRKTSRSRRDWDEDELVLFADNDANLYRQKDAFLANVHKKMKRGTYDPVQANKLWLYYVDRAAKQYAKEFGGVWNKIFPKPVREKAAAHYAKTEHAMIQRGEYDRYPPVHTNGAKRDHTKRPIMKKGTKRDPRARRAKAKRPAKRRAKRSWLDRLLGRK